MNGFRRRRAALLTTMVMAGAAGQAVMASPASASCHLIMRDDEGNAAARVCVSGGTNEQGNPYANVSIIQDYRVSNEEESGTHVVASVMIVEGEDVPKTLSAATRVDGTRVGIGVDLSGEPDRTNACISDPRLVELGGCVYVSDLVELGGER